MMFAESQNRGDHRTGGMNDVARMRIVVIENVRADAVDQRCIQNIESFFSAKNAGLCRPGKKSHRRNGNAYRFVTRAAQRAAHPIQKRACRFLSDRSGKITGLCRYDIPCKGPGDVLDGFRCLWTLRSEMRQAQTSGRKKEKTAIHIYLPRYSCANC